MVGNRGDRVVVLKLTVEFSTNLKTMEKKLGKIENVKFGIGGYQDAMIGLHVTLGNMRCLI